MRTAVRLLIIPLTVVRPPRGRKPKSRTAGSITAQWWIQPSRLQPVRRLAGGLEKRQGAADPRQS
jgi:hypothetical protein